MIRVLCCCGGWCSVGRGGNWVVGWWGLDILLYLIEYLAGSVFENVEVKRCRVIVTG